MLCPKGLRGHHDQVLRGAYGTAQIIGERAVGKRDVMSSFKQLDLGLFVQSTHARRGGSTTGDAADYDQFHMHEHLSFCLVPP